jgi:hypothetical protein
MTDDLVKRLRNFTCDCFSGNSKHMTWEAAARIEELEAALREIANPANWEGMDWVSHGVPKWIARAALEGNR